MNINKFQKYELIWYFSFVLNIIAFIFAYYKIYTGPKILTLHYNVIVGADWLGKSNNLYFLPISGLIINIVNLTLYKKFKDSPYFYRHLFSFTSFYAQAILLFALLLILKKN